MRAQLILVFAGLMVLGFGCRRVENYPYDFAAALRFQADSSQVETFVAVVGQTNGPFRDVGAVSLLPGQGGRFVAGDEGVTSSWSAPAGHKELYRGYQFEDPLKRRMIVVKSVVQSNPLTNQMQRTGR